MQETITSRCWSKIGVWSENLPSCEKLAEVIHCRNCDVYVREGRNVFEKEIPADYISQWTKDYAGLQLLQKKKKNSVIIFRIGKEWFGLPTKYFSEIVESRKVQCIPHHTGKVLLGMVNVRGQIRLCFSLKALLGLGEDVVPSDKTLADAAIHRNIVVQIEDDTYVFPVDEISGVYRFDESEYQTMPSTVNKDIIGSVDGILSLPEKQVACLNPFRLQSMIEEVFVE